jgi:hypothetical protein
MMIKMWIVKIIPNIIVIIGCGCILLVTGVLIIVKFISDIIDKFVKLIRKIF